MAISTNERIRKIGTWLQNPRVQQILAWGVPITIGWILSLFDKPRDKAKKP